MSSQTPFRTDAKTRSSKYQQYLDECNSFHDTLLGLCAGRSALLRIQRKRTLKYFQSLPSPHESSDRYTEVDGTQAGLADKGIAGERVANRSFLQPWKEPNFGITFRYRISPETPLLQHPNASCSTSCGPASSPQPSETEKEPERYPQSSTTLDIPKPKDTNTITLTCHLGRHKESSPAAAPLPTGLRRAKRHIIDLDAACASAISAKDAAAKNAIAKTENDQHEVQKVTIARSPRFLRKASLLKAHLAANTEQDRWDMMEWINLCSGPREDAPNPVPRLARQCKEYCLTKNFNPLSISPTIRPDQVRMHNYKMAVLLANRAAPKTLAARQEELARMMDAAAREKEAAPKIS